MITESWRNDVFKTVFQLGDAQSLGLEGVPSEVELARLTEAFALGIGLAFWNPHQIKREISFEFLRPIVDTLASLSVITVDTISDLRVLENASCLRALILNCAGRLDVDLSRLPNLEEYQGVLTRGTSSVLRNPGLRVLEVAGNIPSTPTSVSGPVEQFAHFGRPNITNLPEFEQPKAMRKILRSRAHSFDLAQLLPFVGLETIRLQSIRNVKNIDILNHLSPNLNVEIIDCGTTESWEQISDVGWLMLIDVDKPVSHSYAVAGTAKGWAIPTVHLGDAPLQGG